MLPPKVRNDIKVKNISSVEKDAPGHKPSKVSEKIKSLKIIRNVPRSDKDTKVPANKAQAKK